MFCEDCSNRFKEWVYGAILLALLISAPVFIVFLAACSDHWGMAKEKEKWVYYKVCPSNHLNSGDKTVCGDCGAFSKTFVGARGRTVINHSFWAPWDSGKDGVEIVLENKELSNK